MKHVTFDKAVLLSHLGKVSKFYSDNRAMGIAYTFNPLFCPYGPTETCTVCEAKLVVLSAGSFGTPGILEHSGIGATAILESVGMKQRVELPSIGEDYKGLSATNRLPPTVHIADFGTRR